METKMNSFSLRGESGIVKVVSDSVFDPHYDGLPYADRAECDLIVESNGFRVNKVITLDMPKVIVFLREVSRLARGEGGEADLSNEELALKFIREGASCRVECEMNDEQEGKENSIRVKYPLEPDYLRDLEKELSTLLESSSRRA
jgi:hypothetical protein